MPVFSSLDKDQIKVVIDEVTRWLDLAEEGDRMTLPGIAGRQEATPPSLEAWGQVVAVRQELGGAHSLSHRSWCQIPHN